MALVFFVIVATVVGFLEGDGGDGYCERYSGCVDDRISEVHAPVWLDDSRILFYFGPPPPTVEFAGRPFPEWRGAGGLYVVDVAGEELRQLRRPSRNDKRFSDDYSPNLTPDGTTVVYATFRFKTDGERNFELASTRVDGKDFRRLTKTPHQETNPVVSPDGEHIAFLSSVRHSGETKVQLYVMDSDGDNVRALAPEVIAFGTPPAWSPDGRRLAFVAREEWEDSWSRYRLGLFVVDLDGSNLARLGDAFSEVAWSPDGEHLAFAGWPRRYGSAGDLSLVSPDGGEVRTLTEGCATLAWSPDGREVACASIWLTATDVETGQVRVIHRSNRGGALRLKVVGLAWSPDGSRLAVRQAPVNELGPCGRVLLYTINRDGSSFHPLVYECDGELTTASDGSISSLEAESRAVAK